MQKVRAIRFSRTGGPEVLSWDEVTLGSPGPGQVLVRHKAIGLNFIDTYHRSGLYPVPSLPSGIGLEAAGVIEGVGDGVADFAIGDRVAYGTGPIGAYSEARNIPAEKLVKLPDGIDDRVAAAIMLKGLTAQYLLRRTYQVKVQADAPFRATADNIAQLKVRNAAGAMIPLGSVVQVKQSHGPDQSTRYNGYPAADINGGPAPGFSSGFPATLTCPRRMRSAARERVGATPLSTNN